MYFRGDRNAWLLDVDYGELASRLGALGVRARVAVSCSAPEWDGHVTIVHRHSHHERGLDGFDPDCSIDGLQHAVAEPTLQRSKYIWNALLIPHLQRIRGTVERSSRADFSGSRRKTTWSRMGRLVRDNAWLPDANGEFHEPGDISPDELPEGFDRNEALAAQLQMKASTVRELAEGEGVPAEDLRQMIECFKTNPNAAREFIKRTLEAGRLPTEEEEDDGPYADLLEGRFSRTGRSGEGEDEVPSSAVAEPQRRREKIAKEINAQKDREPPAAMRFKRVPRRQWEGKNNDARIFLQEQYQGRCQVCGSVFDKRDGDPYFEGLYLVPHTWKRYADRPGNILCLCATCCAKFQHGSVEAEDILGQIERFKAKREGGDREPAVAVKLCGEEETIEFTERHMMDLQELLKAAD